MSVKLSPRFYDISPRKNTDQGDFLLKRAVRAVCTKFGQNPLKDLDSRVFTRMLCGKNVTLTIDLENQ